MRRREFNSLIGFVGAEGGMCEAPGLLRKGGVGGLVQYIRLNNSILIS